MLKFLSQKTFYQTGSGLDKNEQINIDKTEENAVYGEIRVEFNPKF